MLGGRGRSGDWECPSSYRLAPATRLEAMTSYTVRPESPADVPAIDALLQRVFPTGYQAQLVTDLRGNPASWEPGISLVAHSATEVSPELAGYVLLSRCWVGSWPALALATLAVHPNHRGRGAGTTLVHQALELAGKLAQETNAPTSVIVLGDPAYYCRFGFRPAAHSGVRAYIDGMTPAELAQNLQALNLTPDYPPLAGEVTWPAEYRLDQGDDL